MYYDASALSAKFDKEALREWNRLVATPVDEVSLHIHTYYLRKHIPAGARVLEIGAGSGRFTQVLAGLGARILVADISPGQLALNRQFASELGWAPAVEDFQVADITDLSRYPADSFDRVVVYGGPFSYVLDLRDVALRQCLRVLRPGGVLLGSVMSLWGSAHRFLPYAFELPPEQNQRLIATGDQTPATIPTQTGNFMHLFRGEEVRAWLQAAGLRILDLSACGVLACGRTDDLTPIRQDPGKWNELLRMEVEASADPACFGMGTHLIFAAER